MSNNDYVNLYMDAGIADQNRQETYGRHLDVVLGQEGIGVEEIVGVGERGTGGSVRWHRSPGCR
ncbi:MAG: hypothetical protein BGO11_07410 [Solirubrobacterales bacterium 70-9]|nr:MAG: hypothetical protein BGO11_07410 [Solirubrobacterales bacterium 70-9]